MSGQKQKEDGDLLLDGADQARPGLISRNRIIVSRHTHRTPNQARRVVCSLAKFIDSLSQDVE
jgi:hypothetical protein